MSYRHLNGAIIPDSFPQPSRGDCIDSLREAAVFTVLELLWGYWQVPIKDEDKNRTTITSQVSTYRYTRLPFGVRNAPTIFERAPDIILSIVRCKTCLVYIHDDVIFSKHNCQLFRHWWGAGTTLPVWSKIKAAQVSFRSEESWLSWLYAHAWSLCNCLQKGCCNQDRCLTDRPHTNASVLGAGNEYRRFIKVFFKIARKHNDYLRKDKELDSLDPTTEAPYDFKLKKSKLVDPPVLALAQPYRPYMVDTNESTYTLGAVLLQQKMTAVQMSALRSAAGARLPIKRIKNTGQPNRSILPWYGLFRYCAHTVKGRHLKSQQTITP